MKSCLSFLLLPPPSSTELCRFTVAVSQQAPGCVPATVHSAHGCQRKHLNRAFSGSPFLLSHFQPPPVPFNAHLHHLTISHCPLLPCTNSPHFSYAGPLQLHQTQRLTFNSMLLQPKLCEVKRPDSEVKLRKD